MKRGFSIKPILPFAFVISLFLYFNIKANADVVKLNSGDSISGKVIKQTDLYIILDHNDLGQLDIPRNRIKLITVDNVKSNASEKYSKQAQIKTSELQEPQITEKTIGGEPNFPVLNTMASKLKKKGWSFSADLSLNASSGNTDEQSIRAGMDIKRILPDRRLVADFSYYNKVSDGSITDNKFSFGLLRDWIRPESSVFYFLLGRYDYDEFESWKQRVSAHAGPGFNLVKEDNFLLDLRIGAGTRKEFGSENDNLKFEGLGRLDFEWKITKKQTLDLSSSIFPVFSDFSDFRTRTTADWRWRFDEELELSLLMGFLHEYESIVDPGKERGDFRFYTGLQFSF
jgi:putative salt-induced outer membrane protein YdiY